MRDVALVDARATTRRVARTFALACRLLPRDVRDDVYLLYLVFRTLDDAVDDGAGDADERLAAVEAWSVGATRMPSREVDLLDELARRHPLPRSAFADFCAGMRDDLQHVSMDTDGDLDRYCYRVAGTVGIVMAHVLGMSDPDRALPAAAALGQAMQLTNVLRDIDEDLRVGRVYVPRTAIERCGGSLAPGERKAVLRDQIARADALYETGCAGIALLTRGQRAIGAAGAMYREILRQIEREGYGEQPGRAVVSRRRKLVVATLGR
ncbi:MAG: 15-cis-phytoene synthase [Solirubrobacteraceae bacterium]|jgi:phytoene synthase|nr:15-cis-phytoene synthase [Solirubrobacteraceae bacterium]